MIGAPCFVVGYTAWLKDWSQYRPLHLQHSHNFILQATEKIFSTQNKSLKIWPRNLCSKGKYGIPKLVKLRFLRMHRNFNFTLHDCTLWAKLAPPEVKHADCEVVCLAMGGNGSLFNEICGHFCSLYISSRWKQTSTDSRSVSTRYQT